MERKNTHANKAESYDIGRPKYPKVFYKKLKPKAHDFSHWDEGK